MTFGYRSKEKAYSTLGPRAKKRIEQRDRRRRRVRIFLAAAAIILVLTTVFWLGGFRFLPDLLSRLRFGSQGRQAAELKRKTTILFVGSEKRGNRETAHSLLVLMFNPDRGRANGVEISGNTFVEIPGHGFERIAEAMSSGMTATKATIRNFLGLRVDNYVKLGWRALERAVNENDLVTLLSELDDTDLTSEEAEQLSRGLARLKEDDINIVPLPVNPISVGAETYYEPRKEEADELVRVFWGLKPHTGPKPVRVIVLNGCGEPGIAGKVAQRLIARGYRVIDTKNAEDFGYKETQIIMYTGKTKAAFAIRDMLGVGVVVNRRMAQDIADICVVVGSDYVKKTKRE